MRSSAESRRPRKAFTLIETLVAIAIAAVSLLIIFEVFPMGFAASARSQARTTATAIASQILACFRNELSKTTGQNAAFFFNYNASSAPGWTNDYVLFSSSYASPTPNFEAGSEQFFWRVIVHEVTDLGGCTTNPPTVPLYATFIDDPDEIKANNRTARLIGCRRVTAYVRGPFNEAIQATYFDPRSGQVSWPAGGSKIAACEVAMTTYVTSPSLGSTILMSPTYPGVAEGHPTNAPSNVLVVENADNFSVFNRGGMTTAEFNDTGPYDSVLGKGGNYLGLDNIWISAGGTYPCAPPYHSSNAEYSALDGESNKILRITKFNNYFLMYLARPIRGYPTGDAAEPYTGYLSTRTEYPAGSNNFIEVGQVRSLVVFRRTL